MDSERLAATIYEYCVAEGYVINSPKYPKWSDLTPTRQARWLGLAAFILEKVNG